MPYFTGYKNEGEETFGPFLAPPSGQNGPQRGFIVDLRLFLSGRHEYTAYLRSVSYDSESDSWTLAFADPANDSILVSGTVSRTVNGEIRKSASMGSGSKVAVFSTGRYWEDPTWGGEGSWQKTYSATTSEVEASKLLNGPKTIRRIIIQGQADPFSGEYPRGGSQTIIGGYNLQLSDIEQNQGTLVSPLLQNVAGQRTLVISAGYGLGAGAPTDTPDTSRKVLTINGLRGDSVSENFSIASLDCIKVTVPPTTQSGAIIDHEIQIESDCGPCCGCENYRAVSAAIEMSYSRIVSLQKTLKSMYTSTYGKYQQGMDRIKQMKN